MCGTNVVQSPIPAANFQPRSPVQIQIVSDPTHNITSRPRTASTRISLGSNVSPSTIQHSPVCPPESPAVKKIKANAATKDRQFKLYTQRYVVGSPSQKSAKLSFRSQRSTSGPNKSRISSAPVNFNPSNNITLNKAVEFWEEYLMIPQQSDHFENNPYLSAKQVNFRRNQVIATNIHTQHMNLKQDSFSSALPRPPGMTTNTPQHSASNPLGAHTHGFYAKQHQSTSRIQKRSSNLIDMMKDSEQRKLEQQHYRSRSIENVSGNCHTISYDIGSKFDEKEEGLSNSKIPKNGRNYVLDAESVDFHLSVLTDLDLTTDRIFECLGWLTSILDNGG
ncbi:hypothetical protein HK096_008287 [Nowakowskiella sp. JEL0078]|nr:hypothetical protein HK096_008287 [Nowakowskiella sp. JEL0078]